MGSCLPDQVDSAYTSLEVGRKWKSLHADWLGLSCWEEWGRILQCNAITEARTKCVAGKDREGQLSTVHTNRLEQKKD